MDNPSPTPSPSRSEPHWPQVPAVRGQNYGVDDPVNAGHKLVVMSAETWLDLGTYIETQRRQLKEAVEAGQALKTQYDILVQQLANTSTRHHNLREAVKTERLRQFNKPRKKKRRR